MSSISVIEKNKNTANCQRIETAYVILTLSVPKLARDRGSVKSSQGGTAQPEGLWGELLMEVSFA